VGATLTTSGQKLRIDDTFIVMSSEQTNASVMEDRCPTLMSESGSPPMVAGRWPADLASTLNTKYADKQGLEDQHINSGAPLFVPYERQIRRMTPLEWERLQGFPDGYTAVPGAKDAPRYKALGNSMTQQVMGWIGRRIGIVDNMLKNNTI